MGRGIGSRVRSRLVRVELARSERGGLPSRLARDRRLRAIVDHAREQSPFYRELYREACRRPSLQHLPVVTKPQLMDRFDEWATDREITLAGVQAFVADKSNIGEPFLGRYLVSHTAGSTGVKALVVRDRASLQVHNLLMEQRLRWSRQVAGAESGRRAIAAVAKLDGHHTIYAGWKFGQEGSPPGAAPQIRFFSIHSPVGRLVEGLNDFQPSVLNSSPAMLLQLAERQLAGELAIQPRVILSGGETLTPSAGEALTRSFGCPIRNIYGSTEFKFIAFGCERGWLHVNDDRVILEPVDRNRQPVPPGTASDSVLLTDLVNRTQPLIRYEMGDRVIVKQNPCECGRTLTAIRVEGRSRTVMTFRNPQGDHLSLHPSVVEGLFFDTPEILQYQIVIPGSDEMRIRIRLDEEADDRVWSTFMSGLRRRLDDHDLGFVTVRRDLEPPMIDPKTGKVPNIIRAGE